MKQFLIVVDIQRDFVDGTLGTPEAAGIVDNAADCIRGWNGEIFVTMDTHSADYLNTAEGKKLPVPHCILGTDGWALDDTVAVALTEREQAAPGSVQTVRKPTFGAVELPRLIAEAAGGEDFSVTLIGLCTDICVISNALLLKANFPEKTVSVRADCCAGVTPALHDAALQVMQSCQIDVI